MNTYSVKLKTKWGGVFTFMIILVVLVTVSQGLFAQVDEANKRQVVRSVARNYIEAGMKQFERGFYAAAKQSLSRAKDYEAYLTQEEQNQLNALLIKAQTAVSEREQIAEYFQAAEQLMQIEKQLEAKRQIQPAIAPEPKREPIIETPVIPAEPQITPLPTQPQIQTRPQTQTIIQPQPEPREKTYIDVVNKKRSILQGHTRAVVNDAIEKADAAVAANTFDKAVQSIEKAKYLVKKNRLHLGDEMYAYYSNILAEKTAQIMAAKQGYEQMQQQQRIKEAELAQEQYRDQMQQDRQERVVELMANAKAHQKQQRYEEALGQLESLLAIDPLNDEALLLKQTLEDIISFREQIEIQKESDEQRVKLLMNTDRSAIPYADELTYPKNWREIAAKRKPDTAIGEDPVNAAVFRQLQQTVNLTQFSPEMSFGEAIEILRNSVDPPLTIIVNWLDLSDNADIDQFTPINMDPVRNIRLETALDNLLDLVSGGFVELGYVVDDGIIRIATKDSLPAEMETMVYDVTDLLGQPANFYAQAQSSVSVDVQTAGGEGFDQEDQIDRDQLTEQAGGRANSLVLLIQDTVVPESWFDYGGEGTISVYQNRKLIVRQTRPIHYQIQALMEEMRRSLGHQVAIEARFLVVGENFLEDLGIDIDLSKEGQFKYTPEEFESQVVGYQQGNFVTDAQGNPLLVDPLGPAAPNNYIPIPTYTTIQDQLSGYTPTGFWNFNQASDQLADPELTGVPGSFGDSFPALNFSWEGFVLDTLQANIMIRASKAHRDSKTLTAPKVTVLSGESAAFRVQRNILYPGNPEFEITTLGGGAGFQDQFLVTVEVEDRAIVSGTLLNITPTIQPDKKHVLLNIVGQLQDFLGFDDFTFDIPFGGALNDTFTLIYPATELSRVETRVSVPDSGTLLLGGQKVTFEEEKESGVPVLSKIPIIGRAFSNRSSIKDEKILLILVQPKIILQEEAEAQALAAFND